MEPAPHSDHPSLGLNGKAEKLPAGKLHSAQYIVALILAVLITGLWRLQVLGADNFRALADANRIRKVPILAPRGRIFDRNGRLLVDNYPSVSCYLLRDQAKNINLDLPLISRGLNIPVDQIQAILRRYESAPRYQPIPLKQDITPDEQAFIEAHRNELPELETIDVQRRLYPRDGFASHLIGYVGEVSEEMLNNPRYAFYDPGDVVGRSGVEASYDSVLRGTDGYKDVIVNSRGKELGHLGQTLAIPGKDLRLTIDLDLQMAAEKALDGKVGAIVALDPHNGEVLALVSRPTFDPNQFSGRLTKNYWNEILSNPDHPLLDKATQAQLAPGSTFKIIMSVAGLQEGIAQDMHVLCNGGADFYGHYYHCHAVHGMVDITKGIYQSCDTFFYTLAEKLGIGRIAKYATMFGLGQKTGIDLPQEATGVMPSEEWKIRNFKEKWFAGETISVGIGQGSVAVTPVQLARALGGIASGGLLVRPHVAFPQDLPSNVLPASASDEANDGKIQVPIDPKNWDIITDAMAMVPNPGGTAAGSHLEGIDFAGKTGTAQTISAAAKAKLKGSKAEYRNNAWFVGVEPRRNPEIVICVLLEQGEEGPV